MYKRQEIEAVKLALMKSIHEACIGQGRVSPFDVLEIDPCDERHGLELAELSRRNASLLMSCWDEYLEREYTRNGQLPTFAFTKFACGGETLMSRLDIPTIRHAMTAMIMRDRFEDGRAESPRYDDCRYKDDSYLRNINHQFYSNAVSVAPYEPQQLWPVDAEHASDLFPTTKLSEEAGKEAYNMRSRLSSFWIFVEGQELRQMHMRDRDDDPTHYVRARFR